ncbi:Mobile element protein [Candidatus Enterovibrio escicola]|uniref:Mobile element protein n=1 Tax=Candidatus Enterovibrio escicola TaxID=1927127 RepID=A0A2A5T0V4_9GAMM|nr:Mobile element protein [Candidatus Enterovibrio escacola]
MEFTHCHQVFELPKKSLYITEYQLFHGWCWHCNYPVQANLPDDPPSGQLDPRRLSHIVVLFCQYPLSICKIKRPFMDQYGTHFSI